MRGAIGILVLGASLVGFDTTHPANAQTFVYRAKSALIGVEPAQPAPSLALAFDDDEYVGLTVGDMAVILVKAPNAERELSYREAATAFMPGLSVDPSTGMISGVPEAVEGTVFVLAVDAVSNGNVIASVESKRSLRAQLSIERYPDALVTRAGEPFPANLMTISSSGGDQASVRWFLMNAPSWLEITPAGVLRVAGGYPATAMPTRTVTVAALDGEGRYSQRVFSLTVNL